MDIQKEREEFEAWVIENLADGRSMSWEDWCWKSWQAAKAQAVPEGFVLVEREKLAMIFETATNALVYHVAPPKHDALSIIQGIARNTMIEAQEPSNDQTRN